MKKIILIFILLNSSLLLTSCFRDTSNVIKISDVKKDTIIPIHSPKKNPVNIVFRMTGNISDTCKIMGVKIAPNDLKRKVFIDCYNQDTNFKYESYKAKTGSLKIHYTF